MTNKERVNLFIEQNGLTFKVGERNTHSTILSGFALWLGYTNATDLINDLSLNANILDADLEEELEKTFNFAQSNDYGYFWDTEEAKKSYNF